MNKIKKVLSMIAIAIFSGFVAVFAYTSLVDQPTQVIQVPTEKTPVQLTSLNPQGSLPDLTFASEKSVHAVVHITSTVETQARYSRDPFEWFFGDQGNSQSRQPQSRKQEGFGSGVIISEDGYIVTNNHVIEGANSIKVALNDNREFEATLIGRDPSTDIALLKIEEDGLPYLNWGESDQLKLGEWVLAVGNPFNLTSTVTAGIVSAKSRSIGIMRSDMPIESFIQTDAAVNPGNSGGALVNQRGELVGINTAIASRTGSYSGYSFAVPAGIAKKVVKDLMDYGEVQRALLGIQIREITAESAKDLDIDKIEGIYVAGVTEDSGAKEAGIKEKDILISIENKKVNTFSELSEQVGQHRPGDKVKVLVKRDGVLKQFDVVLRNLRGDTSIMKETISTLGAELKPIDSNLRQKFRIAGGLQVKSIGEGKFKDNGIEEGFIITEVNKRNVATVDQLKKIMDQTPEDRPILIEGFYPSGERYYFILKQD